MSQLPGFLPRALLAGSLTELHWQHRGIVRRGFGQLLEEAEVLRGHEIDQYPTALWGEGPETHESLESALQPLNDGGNNEASPAMSHQHHVREIPRLDVLGQMLRHLGDADSLRVVIDGEAWRSRGMNNMAFGFHMSRHRLPARPRARLRASRQKSWTRSFFIGG